MQRSQSTEPGAEQACLGRTHSSPTKQQHLSRALCTFVKRLAEGGDQGGGPVPARAPGPFRVPPCARVITTVQSIDS